MRAVGLRARAIACALGLLISASAQPAAAESVTVMWDASPDANAVGYIVYIGTQPGVYSETRDVGNALSFAWANGVAGQDYYFAVAAYASGPLVGARSVEVPWIRNRPPVLLNPGPQSAVANSSVAFQLSASDPEGAGLSYNASGLPPGLSASHSGSISGTPSAPGAFVVTATVTDGELSDAETFVLTIAPAPQDQTPPAVVIAVPNANPPAPAAVNPAPAAPANPDNAVANGPVQTGPATPPNVVPTVVIPPVTPPQQPVAAAGAVPTPEPAAAVAANRFAGWRDANRNAPEANTPTRSVLSRGPRPAAAAPSPAPAPEDTNPRRNLSDRLRAAVRTVPNAAQEPAPAVNDSPATPMTVSATTQAARNTSWGRAKLATTVTDQPFITLAGSATDDRGISRVEWVTDRGLSGTATGTDTWIAAVPLLRGLNRVTVNVRDASGNVTSNTVTVQYNEPSTLKK